MSTDRIIGIAGCAVGAIGMLLGIIGLSKAGSAADKLEKLSARERQSSIDAGDNLKQKLEALQSTLDQRVGDVTAKMDAMKTQIVAKDKLKLELGEMLSPRFDEVKGTIRTLRADTTTLVEKAKTDLRNEIRGVNDSVAKVKAGVPGIARHETIQQLKSLGLK